MSPAPCPPSPTTVVVIKKPGGTETVFDMSADFETVSGVDDEKYVLCVFHCVTMSSLSKQIVSLIAVVITFLISAAALSLQWMS